MRLIPPKPNPDAVPVTVIAGFLGSGKTTLINRLTARPEAADWAVLINEFGEVALDQHFLDRSAGETVVLPSGCLCCVAGADVEAAMATLYARRRDDALTRFRRLIVETSGLADPAPLVQALIASPLLTRCYRLESVVATVDATNAARAFAAHEESVRQIAHADAILLTKTDLAGADEAARVRAMVSGINARATLREVVHGDIAPAELFTLAQRDSGETEPLIAPTDHEHAHHHSLIHRGIASISLTAHTPLDWPRFDRWFHRLRIGHGERLLRAKGLLAIAGEDRPVIVQAVNHVIHPPQFRDRWPDADRRSRLVIIGQHLDRAEIEAGWCVVREEPHTSRVPFVPAQAGTQLDSSVAQPATGFPLARE